MPYLFADRLASYGGLNASGTITRTEGVAPLGVFVDMTATTDASTSYPFHDLLYITNWDDAGSGTFTTGRKSGLSKNTSYGAIAAHVYETPDDYSPSTLVFNGKVATIVLHGTITVDDPDVEYAGTDTVVVNNDGDSDFTGKPDLAAELNTNDLETALAAITGTVKRLLFKRGGTWEASSNTTPPAGARIGAYGTGADPIWVRASGGTTMRFSNSDCAVQDIDFNGGDFSNGRFCDGSLGSQITLLRVGLTGYETGVAATVDEFIVQDCSFGDVSTDVSGSPTYYGIFGGPLTQYFALLGTEINLNSVTLGVFAFRCARMRKSVVSCNTLHVPKNSALNIQAPAFTGSNYSELFVVSDNKIVGTASGGVGMCGIGAGDGIDGRIRNAVVERNLIDAISVNTEGFQILPARQITVRNNITRRSGNGNFANFNIGWGSGTLAAPEAEDIWLYNNSSYAATNQGFSMVWVNRTGVSNVTGRNNAAWAPNATNNRSGAGGAPVMLQDAGGTNIDFDSSNWSDEDITGTCPFTDTTPSDPDSGEFNPTGAAVAGGDNTVSVFDDFLSARRSYGNKTPVMDAGAVQTS